MKYAVLKCINGNFSINTEHGDLDSAKVAYHGLCQTLWNAPDVLTGCVMIVDENLFLIDAYKDYITHNAPVDEVLPDVTAESEE